MRFEASGAAKAGLPARRFGREGVTSGEWAQTKQAAGRGRAVCLSRGMGAHVKTKVLPVPFKGRQLPDVRLSDHSPFWDEGYNAVMVTDTSFMRNPHCHQPSDTIETLNLPFLQAVIDGLDAAISGC